MFAMKLSLLTLTIKRRGIIALVFLGLIFITCQASLLSADPISPQNLANRLESPQAPIVLDVRSEAEYADGHIPGAVNIPYREIPARLDELMDFKTREIVVYCEVGVRAGIAELALEQAGFQHIVPLQGDISAWRQEGLPLETDSSTPEP